MQSSVLLSLGVSLSERLCVLYIVEYMYRVHVHRLGGWVMSLYFHYRCSVISSRMSGQCLLKLCIRSLYSDTLDHASLGGVFKLFFPKQRQFDIKERGRSNLMLWLLHIIKLLLHINKSVAFCNRNLILYKNLMLYIDWQYKLQRLTSFPAEKERCAVMGRVVPTSHHNDVVLEKIVWRHPCAGGVAL